MKLPDIPVRDPAAIADLAQLIGRKAGNAARFIVAVAGAPASGKSTLAEDLRDAIGSAAVVVPMDGFHFDDAILNARGQRARKGADFTFDVRGFEALLRRIRSGEADIAIPVFDRTMELSRNAASLVDGRARFIIVEGNYLLLNRAPWTGLSPLFDFTVYLSVAEAELERRLIQRWLDHGFDMAYARNWIASNDMLNIRDVMANSAVADLTL